MSVASVLRLGFGSGGTAGSVLRLGYGAGVVPPVVAPASVPGPADGPDDIARRRWLEWRGRQRRRPVARVVRPESRETLQPPPSPPLIERPVEAKVIDVAPALELLARNRIAMAAQRAALEKAEQARRDEEDLIAMLLEDV